MAQTLAETLKASFNDQVEVRYVDVDVVGLDSYPSMKRVLQLGYPYPITLINGEPRYAGGIMVPEIKQSIEDILKQGE